MVYDLICEGKCNPNIEIVDRLASQYMSERSNVTMAYNGRNRADDLVRLQRKLEYTMHVRCEIDMRYYICTECTTRRRFGA